MLILIRLVNVVINILKLLIIIEVILSYFPRARYSFREVTRVIEKITEPMMRPFRRLVPPSKTGNLDISPILAIVALEIIRILITILVGSSIWP